MPCRCQERAQALRRAADNVVRGQVRDAVREVAAVGRTLREDVRSGALARAAQARLVGLRYRMK